VIGAVLRSANAADEVFDRLEAVDFYVPAHRTIFGAMRRLYDENQPIDTVTVVNNNHSLNQEQGGVEAIYGGRTSGSDELWLFPDADFARIAESMGCFGATVHRPGELASALDQAFAAGRPAVVDVKTHVEGIAPKAWEPPHE